MAGGAGFPAASGLDYGVCLPSPNLWGLTPSLSLWGNVGLVFLCSLFVISLTKHYNFIPANNISYATVLLLMSTAMPWTIFRFGSATLMLVVTLICIYILFGLYDRRNTAEGVFIIFTFLSWGSMVNHGFLLLMPIFCLGTLFMKALHGKQFMAMLLGIMAPYWILLATGLVTFADFRPLEIYNLFRDFSIGDGSFRFLLTIGLSAMVFLILLLANAMRTDSVGVKMRAYKSFVNLLGFALLWYMVFDSRNIMAYTTTFFLTIGFQVAWWNMAVKKAHKSLLMAFLILAYIGITFCF